MAYDQWVDPDDDPDQASSVSLDWRLRLPEPTSVDEIAADARA
jgi:hypothetical protein